MKSGALRRYLSPSRLVGTNACRFLWRSFGQMSGRDGWTIATGNPEVSKLAVLALSDLSRVAGRLDAILSAGYDVEKASEAVWSAVHEMRRLLGVDK